MSIDPRTRRFPKVLADRLKSALAMTRPLGADRCMELLATYRRNMIRGFLNHASGSSDGSSEDYEPFPVEWFDKIKELDQAFQQLHKFKKPGGSDAYMAAEVYSVAQKLTATGHKLAGDTNVKILDDLRKLDYLNAKRSQKGKIKKAISERHTASERHVDNMIRHLKASGNS